MSQAVDTPRRAGAPADGQPSAPAGAGSWQQDAGGWPPPGGDNVYPPPGRFSRFVLRLWARSPGWLAPLAILACFGAAVGYVLVREPVDGAEDTTTCLAKLTTGFDCPGCGGTRAFYFLVRGDLPAAARHHLVFVFAVPFLLWAYVAWAGNRIFRWRLPQLRPGPWTATVFMVVLGAFTVLRNLPWAPFTWFYV